MSENLGVPLCRLSCGFASNICDLSHMTAISSHIEFPKGRLSLNGRNMSANSIDTATAVAFHLETCTSTGHWNERDALCI
jgi:hypothetical protein